MKTIIFLLFSMLCLYSSADGSVLALNQALVKKCNELEQKRNGLLAEADLLEKTRMTLTMTAELIEGTREKAPGNAYVLLARERFEPTARILDNRKNQKSLVVIRKLNLTPGKTYRFESEIKLDHIQKTRNVKFGCFIKCSNRKPQWPAAFVGSGSFDWKKCVFTCKIPFSAQEICLLYGIESGFGVMSIRNIIVSEIQDQGNGRFSDAER